jgi:hypothetical protein
LRKARRIREAFDPVTAYVPRLAFKRLRESSVALDPVQAYDPGSAVRLYRVSPATAVSAYRAETVA